MAVCRDTGLVTGGAVMETRSQAKMQEFVDELPPAIFYCTDRFSVYAELVWPEQSEHCQRAHAHGREHQCPVTHLAGSAKAAQSLFQPEHRRGFCQVSIRKTLWLIKGPAIELNHLSTFR
jgi:hypothetical protein